MILSFALCFFVSAVLGHGGHHHDHDHDHSEDDGTVHVLHLNDDNFDAQVAANSMTLIEFFAPWCGHCKKLAPEYEKAASTLYDEIPLASVDCTVEKDLCTKYGIQGFPTLKVFRDDGSNTDYQGGRTAEEIIRYLRKQAQPAYTAVSNEEQLKAAQASAQILVAGFFENENSEEFNAFKQVANALRNDVDFVTVSDKSLANTESASFPSVVLYRKFDTPKVAYTGSLNSEALTKFIKVETFPAFGEIGPENYQKYVDRGLPLFWAFAGYADGKVDAAVHEVVHAVATKFRQLSFVFLDGVKWSQHAKNYGVGEKLPAIVIEDRTNRKNYLFGHELSVSALTEWVQSFVDAKLRPSVKSQEVPASQDEAVYTLVGKTFDEIVNDEKKDVLVEFYAPWCGHCKNLAPKYEELAKEFKSHPSIVIAKLDSTENDSPAEIKGYPTLLFYPSNAKSKPLTYQGERSKQAMSDWIWENAPTLKSSQKSARPTHEDL